MAEVYTGPRAKHDPPPLLIGRVYHRAWYFTRSNGDAWDFSGASGTAQIRTEPDWGTGTLLASPSVSLITDGTDGGVQMVLTEEQTADLAPNGRVYFGLELNVGYGGESLEILWGVLEIRRGVVSLG